MKLVAAIKVSATKEQQTALLATMRRCNQAADWLSSRAFNARVFDKFQLQEAHYSELRSRFGLKSQLAIRVLAKVADAYKKDQKNLHRFQPLGAISFDQRLYSFRHGLATLSLATLDQRILCSTVIGPYFAAMLEGKRGAADLVFRKGKFFFHISVEATEDPPQRVESFLGVDLGIVNLATDSDGHHYTCAQVEAVRQRYASLRRRLQCAGTKSAKKHLRKLAGKEARFRQIENHRISKILVERAYDTHRGLALEDLHGIREGGVKVRRLQRSRFAGWAFFQLRQMTTYKALRRGALVVIVDPHNTSRTCLSCGHVAKENRRNQSDFCCVACGFAGNADVVGACNISSRAAVNRPIVSRDGHAPKRAPKSQGQNPPKGGVSLLGAKFFRRIVGCDRRPRGLAGTA